MKREKTTIGQNINKNNEENKIDYKDLNEILKEVNEELKKKYSRRYREIQSKDHIILKDIDILSFLSDSLKQYPETPIFKTRNEIFKNAIITDKPDGNSRIELLLKREFIKIFTFKDMKSGIKLKPDLKIGQRDYYYISRQGLILLNHVRKITVDNFSAYTDGRGRVINEENIDEKTIKINDELFLKEISEDIIKLDEVLNEARLGNIKV